MTPELSLKRIFQREPFSDPQIASSNGNISATTIATAYGDLVRGSASSTVEKRFWLKTINSEYAVVNDTQVASSAFQDDAWVLYVDKVQGDQTVQLVSKGLARRSALPWASAAA